MHSEFVDAIALVLISFAVISWWRGIWNLLDKYVLPKRFLASQLLSIALGILVFAILVWFFPELIPSP